jgi:hypothetical protein
MTHVLESIHDNIIQTIQKKTVHIGEYREYCYIPNRDELTNKDEIWWRGEDYVRFRFEASVELREFLKYCPGADMKYYSKMLWTILDFDEIYAIMKKENLIHIFE